MDPIDARELRGWLMNLASHLGDAINLMQKITTDYPEFEGAPGVTNGFIASAADEDFNTLENIKMDAEAILEAMLGPEESVENDTTVYAEMLDRLSVK